MREPTWRVPLPESRIEMESAVAMAFLGELGVQDFLVETP
jgi:hypothetical protein